MNHNQLPTIGLVFGIVIFGYGGFLILGGEAFVTFQTFELIDISSPQLSCDDLSPTCFWRIYSETSTVIDSSTIPDLPPPVTSVYEPFLCNPPFEVKVFQDEVLIYQKLGTETASSVPGFVTIEINNLDLGDHINGSPDILRVEVGATENFDFPTIQPNCKLSESIDLIALGANARSLTLDLAVEIERLHLVGDGQPQTHSGNFFYRVADPGGDGLAPEIHFTTKCPIGEVLNNSGICVPIICPDGLHLEGNTCVVNAPSQCPIGEVDPDGDGICEPIICPDGLHLEGNNCVVDTPDQDSLLDNPYLYLGLGSLVAIPSGLALRKN